MKIIKHAQFTGTQESMQEIAALLKLHPFIPQINLVSEGEVLEIRQNLNHTASVKKGDYIVVYEHGFAGIMSESTFLNRVKQC